MFFVTLNAPKNIALLALVFFLFNGCVTYKKEKKSSVVTDNLSIDFSTPPESIQTSVYWYWISDNISKQGVIKDLEAMKKVGINRAFIGNIGLDGTPNGKVKIFSDEWWKVMHIALKTATKLNIDIGIFNSPGWSQSGGPWVKPEQAMRYMTSSEIKIIGGIKTNVQLVKPTKDFQDVSVIAFPAPKDFGNNIMDWKPKISAVPEISTLSNLFDKDQNTECYFSNKKVVINIDAASVFTARSVTFYPTRQMVLRGEIQVKEGAIYRAVKNFVVDRSNVALNVGFEPYGSAVVSIPATTSANFRIVFNDNSGDTSLSELEISSSPKVENYIEKTLAKMFPTPLPYWNEYQWVQQPVIDNQSLVVDPSRILDISKFMNADGKLSWDAPAGNWIVMRTGMAPTGVKNDPAPIEGTGLEVDKMSKTHIGFHFDSFIGEILRRVPAEDRKSFKVVVADSYEKGSQNWTDEFITIFKNRYAYDPISFLPVFKGIVVGSQEQSDRFLWDLRRLVADKVAYDYVGGLREVAHKIGLTTWLENYGHWGFPGEFLQYGGQSDEIGGEFWNEGDLGNIENRAASSAAHIYGKTKVSAESFTSGLQTYARYPAVLKARGDRFFTEGINNSLLHVYIHQPYEKKLPGVNTWFGTEFNRSNTWFNDFDLFVKYLKRCNMMLQQGKYVADVAYFIGEDAPKMTGVQDPALPKGYSFDYINAEVILNRVTVKDGKLTLPDGMSYRVLVLPKLETMRPELLEKIKDLVQQGAVILGPKPIRSPSLENYPNADDKVKNLAAELWNNAGKINKVGKGLVLNNMNMQEALDLIKVVPDFKTTENSLLFIHRKLEDGDAYFISNQENKAISTTLEFRVTGKSPELWDATMGTQRDLVSYSQKGETTIVPIILEPNGSAFIIFRKDVQNGSTTNLVLNFPVPQKEIEIKNPWLVTFDPQMRGPGKSVIFNKLMDWSNHSDEKIKYYSGKAVYATTFNADKLKVGEQMFINLGNVMAIAKVKVNNIEVGGVWTAPYQLDITKALKPGENRLEISVVNTWVNRLIGDMKLPIEQRKTWLFTNPYNEYSDLQSSGLIGPVVLKIMKY